MPKNSDKSSKKGNQPPAQPTLPRRFSNPLASIDSPKANIAHEAHPNLTFQPLPKPTGPKPYHLSLDDVLPADQMAAIRKAERMVLHIVGDTGGVKSPQIQHMVASKMIEDCQLPDPAARPSFFYHLGDVVYYYGQASEYYAQFYDPYDHYPLPIFAIPGNHDGAIADSTQQSLAAFATNFCAKTPVITKDAHDAHRDAMTQPNVYWTLETPFATFIGLYTNVPEGGAMDNDQVAWLVSELTNAPTDKAVIVSTHHPIYSADIFHSGSQYMKQIIEQAFQKTGRIPDAIFTGHVHNYQRFTRTINGHDIPCIVAGAGGYWSLHTMQKDENGNKLQVPHQFAGEDAILANYCEDHHGYMLLEITAQSMSGKYFAVPRPHDPPDIPVKLVDTFTLDLKTHRLNS